MRKPFTPAEAVAKANHAIPDEIIDAAETLIALKLKNGRAVVPLEDLITESAINMHMDREEFLAKSKGTNWLDIEPLFRDSGWKVSFSSAAYCETYFAPYYTFTVTTKLVL